MKTVVLVLLCSLMLQLEAAAVSGRNKVIIVAVSGLRHDYVNQQDLPNFQSLKDDAFYAKKMNIPFITNLFPTLWTVVTGLFPEDHGVIDNVMYDPQMSDIFHGDVDEPTQSWFRSEPIWITAEKSGIKTAVSGWPGASLKMDGIQANKSHLYVEKQSQDDMERRVREFAQWMFEPCDLGLLMIPEPDSTAHVKGPDSPEVHEKMKGVDNVLGILKEQLSSYEVDGKTNIIVIGDHGMAEHKTDSTVYLSDFGVRLGHFSWVPGPMFTTGLLVPHEEYEDMVYRKLKDAESTAALTVYRKDEIPESYRIKNNRRCTPIVVIPDEGYRIELVRPHMDLQYPERVAGMHGYLNSVPSMLTTMIAKGPDFSKRTVESFNSWDIYPLVCSLMDIDGCHGSDGAIEPARKFVKKPLKDVRGEKIDYFKVESSNLKSSAAVTAAGVHYFSVLSLVILAFQRCL